MPWRWTPRARLVASLASIVAATAIAALIAASMEPLPERLAGPAPTAHSADVRSGRAISRPGPRYEMKVRVARVEARRVSKPARPAKLRAAVRAVRETMTGLYATAFVDPRAWRGGSFPGLPRFFLPRARADARDDVADLTLGREARRLAQVRPDRARLDVRFLVGPARRPVAAVAEMDFAGTGFRNKQKRGTIRHRARYVLRPLGKRWLVQAYQVRRDARPAGNVELRGRRHLFVLAIGSDARPGDAVARARADSLHLVGINRRRGVASVLGIPRDSYVAIPGRGTDKINAALSLGGPELQVATVERLTGIDIDGYLLTGFEGFRRAVTSIGRVRVNVPYAMSDAASGARFRAGRTRMSSQEALAFSRNRKDAPGGDFGRSANQGRLIVAAFRELRRDAVRDPTTLFRWIVAGYRHLQTDLGLADMLELLLGALTLDGRVESRVVSGSGGFVGGKSVVRLGSSARRTFTDLRRDAVLGR